MARFEYLEARTLNQAVSLLQRHGEDARLVAGSTDFLVRWRQGVWQPKYVIDIRRIASLGRISYNRSRGLRLGPLVKVQDLQTHPSVVRNYPALAASAASFAGVQVRNLATVGGNICNASPAGDTLPALLAFDAQCRLVGPGGERWAPLADVFTGPGQTCLESGEVLAEVLLPPNPPRTGSLYIKHSPRGAMDIATLGVASVLSLEEDGETCLLAAIALGAVAPTPIRVPEAENLLIGRTVSSSLISEAARAARNAARPIDDIRGTAEHRKAMVEVLTKRTLETSLEMAQGGRVSFEQQRDLAVQVSF